MFKDLFDVLKAELSKLPEICGECGGKVNKSLCLNSVDGENWRVTCSYICSDCKKEHALSQEVTGSALSEAEISSDVISDAIECIVHCLRISARLAAGEDPEKEMVFE